MNWEQIEGNWENINEKVKEQWGKLTDDDVAKIKGKQQQLSGCLQEEYGYAKDRAESELNGFLNNLDRRDDEAGKVDIDDEDLTNRRPTRSV